MKEIRKGISDIVTFLLIGVIGVTAAGTALHFGTDILSKQQTSKDLKEAEDLLLLIEETVEKLASQRGTDSISLSLPLRGTFTIDEATETITYRVETESSRYGSVDVLLNDWLPADSVGVLNTHKYGVLTVKGLGEAPTGQTVKYTVQFRALEDPALRRQITLDIQAPLQRTRSAGTTYPLTIERGEERQVFDTATNKYRVTIPIVLRLE